MDKPACHFDLVVGNKQNEKAFYKQVFDWDFEQTASTGFEEYEFIKGLSSPSGGINLPKEAASKLLLLIHVADIEATLAKVSAAHPSAAISTIMNHPKGGRYAWFTDPEGIVMGIHQES